MFNEVSHFMSQWLEKAPAEYAALDGLSVLIPEWSKLTADGMMSVRAFYAFFRPRFLAHFGHLLEIGIDLPHPLTHIGSDDAEKDFDSSFFIGPGGIDVFIHILDLIYEAIDQTYHLVAGDELCLAAISEVHSASRSLLFSLQHFRAKHPRSLWDPKGCRELMEFFRTGDSKLPVRSHFALVSRTH